MSPEEKVKVLKKLKPQSRVIYTNELRSAKGDKILFKVGDVLFKIRDGSTRMKVGTKHGIWRRQYSNLTCGAILTAESL